VQATLPNPQRILAELKGKIEPVPVGFFYRVGLFLVAVVMVILPVIYVGLIAGAAYGVYWHATENDYILAGKANGRWKALAYFGPLVIGSILVLFMIKPLFSRRRNDDAAVVLNRQEQPLLFQFADKLADMVGAPRPTEISVDCDPNAYAAFRRGTLSMFGRDLKLNIGLPLVMALDLRQLAGVLAHEFGHFAQGAAMRLTYVIRSMNMWFARVVYERDAWDERLEAWAGGNGAFGSSIILNASRLMVWITRLFLRVLMMAGNLVSAFMLRQMEYDADRYDVRVEGGESFAKTSRMLPLLGAATNGAYQMLQHAHQEKRLCDDLPAFILATVPQVPGEVRDQISKSLEETKTGAFDSHPADRDRIAAARAENQRGTFTLDAPASVLFRNFPAVCRAATVAFYRRAIGPELETTSLVSTEKLCASQTREMETDKALGRVFQQQLTITRLLFPVVHAMEADDRGALVTVIEDSRNQMAALLPGAPEAIQRTNSAEEQAMNVRFVRALRSAGFKKIQYRDFGLRSGDDQELASVIQTAINDRSESARLFCELEEHVARRVGAAIELVRQDPSLQKPETMPVADVLALLELLNQFQTIEPQLADLRRDHSVIDMLVGNLQNNPGHAPLVRQIQDLVRKCVSYLHLLTERLALLKYPFEHAQAGISVAAFAIGEIPPAEDLPGVCQKNAETINNLYGLYFRALASVVHFVESVEAALGMPLAPEPGQTPTPALAA
jgi:hypothetical protein